MSHRGALRRFYEKCVDTLWRKEVVGTDVKGNVYMRWHESAGGVQTERREVRWADAYMLYTPTDIPSEWRMWLKKQRDNPPTPEEIQQSATKAAALQQKVAGIEEADRLRRERQAAQAGFSQESRTQDLSHMLRAMQDEDGSSGSKK